MSEDEALTDLALLGFKYEKLQAEVKRLWLGGPDEEWSRGWVRSDFIVEIELLRVEITTLRQFLSEAKCYIDLGLAGEARGPER